MAFYTPLLPSNMQRVTWLPNYTSSLFELDNFLSCSSYYSGRRFNQPQKSLY